MNSDIKKVMVALKRMEGKIDSKKDPKDLSSDMNKISNTIRNIDGRLMRIENKLRKLDKLK